MKRILLSFLLLFFFKSVQAQNSSLGNYPATTIPLSGNIFVYASAAPVNATGLVATTSISFKGSLVVNQSTGEILITNAAPAGVYTITVRSGSVPGLQTSFTLTVKNPACSDGTFSAAGAGGTFTGLQTDMLITDLDHLSVIDMVLTSPSTNRLYVEYNTDISRNLSFLYIDSIPGPVAVAAGDFDRNGSNDLVVVSTRTDAVYLVPGSPLPYVGLYGTIVKIPVNSQPADVEVADFNKDGNPDFATAGRFSVAIRLGTGTGTFTTMPKLPLNEDDYKIAIEDFNRDGNPDIAVLSTSYDSTLLIRLGNGAGGFSNGVTLNTVTGCRSITTADLNNDGYADLIVGSAEQKKALIFLGNSTGSFTQAPAVPLSNAASNVSIATGDFNGDGNTDLAVATGTIYINIRLGNGTGGFTAAPDEVSPIATQLVAVGYLSNFGGRQQLFFPSAGYGNERIYIKSGIGGDINLQGNGSNIPTGTNNPTTTNNTSFGVVITGSSLTRSFTIQNTGSYNIVVNNIFLTGADSSQFTRSGITLPATIGANSSTTFSIIFTLASPGPKTAWVNVASNDCDEALYRFGIRGGPDTAAALHFDGANDYISINDTLGNVGTSDLTFSAWVQAAPNTTMSIMSKGSSCATGSYMEMGLTATGRLLARFGGSASNAQSLTGKTLVGNNVWHHVAVVRKSDTISLYVDGIKDTAATFGAIAPVSNGSQFLLGASNCSTPGNFFSGKMDEVRVFNQALSFSEIQTYLSCELPNPQPGLLAYYRFNQGYAAYSNAGVTTLADSSGKGNTGMLNNFALTGTTSNWAAQGPVISGTTCTGRSTWLGVTSSWSDPGNWSNGFVPSSITNVVIDSGVARMPVITGTVVCYSITLNNGATVRVQAGANLIILH